MAELLLFVDGPGFDLIYDKFASGDALLPEINDFTIAKQAFLMNITWKKTPKLF